MYAVVGCSACSALWMLEGRQETARCPGCARTHQYQKLKKFVETDNADHAREVRNQLEQLTDVKVEVKTSESGKLFGSVQAEDIVNAVSKAGGPKLDKRIVVLPKGLVKKTGNYQVELKLHADVIGKVNFSVVAA